MMNELCKSTAAPMDGCDDDECGLSVCADCNSSGCIVCGYTGHALNDEGIPFPIPAR